MMPVSAFKTPKSFAQSVSASMKPAYRLASPARHTDGVNFRPLRSALHRSHLTELRTPLLSLPKPQPCVQHRLGDNCMLLCIAFAFRHRLPPHNVVTLQQSTRFAFYKHIRSPFPPKATLRGRFALCQCGTSDRLRANMCRF